MRYVPLLSRFPAGGYRSMISVKLHPWWSRQVHVTPGSSFLIGLCLWFGGGRPSSHLAGCRSRVDSIVARLHLHGWGIRIYLLALRPPSQIRTLSASDEPVRRRRDRCNPLRLSRPLAVAVSTRWSGMVRLLLGRNLWSFDVPRRCCLGSRSTGWLFIIRASLRHEGDHNLIVRRSLGPRIGQKSPGG